MDYKEKYEKALKKMKGMRTSWETLSYNGKTFLQDLESIFPELKESEDERMIKFIKQQLFNIKKTITENYELDAKLTMAIDWLEKQDKETSWKPSKEEMDVLYGLAYITNQCDEHKEEIITRLYQDLKREFFNGSSYENMFPNTEDGVRRRSTIQVLEYARSLDNYNQFGKADIDKNIAWLEKQGEPVEINPTEFDTRLQALIGKFDSLPKEELIGSLSFWMNVVQNDGTYKPAEKQIEPKFIAEP